MKQLFALALVTVLAACGGGRSAPEVYTLQAEAPQVDSCRVPSSIKIYEPNAAPGLDSPRMVVIDRPQHQTFYQGVAWSAPAPRVVQAYLADAFERSGMFRSVSTDNDTVKSQWIVETRLRKFNVDLSAGEKAVTRMTVTLMRSGDRQPLLSLPLESERSIAGKNTEQIVQTFNDQLGELTQEMLQQFRSKIGCR